MSSFSPRPNFRDEAFVLRSYKLGEADLILVLLTRSHGVVRAVAKGIRKTKSRFGARLDRFSKVNVQVYRGRSLGKITDTASLASYAGPIVADVDKYFAGAAMLELAQILSTAEGSSEAVFSSLDAGLALLAGTDPATPELPPVSVADRFVLHGLAEAGWMPSLVDCAQCGRPGPHRAFHPRAGGSVCVLCRPPGSATPPPEAVRLLWLLAHDRLAVAAQVAANPGNVRVAHELLLAHVRQQLEVACPAYAAL
ncbi:DNA repair protein RecO [Corynebacterium urealyticum]|uniref:DNA repair protein RecO n=1 Tax=Corynebacterium urealyticum (strain ATCC 43042 / DSM 7109) TaxID=504474 RepID=B1VGI0_CORU7|nr:DNA repair protein RecO [Corynebacterium urealyticum]QQC41306.1 DNA repair protein RecO [Corynebacterium urealyticum]QQE51690.1 DNA repair protein RecO [Corynebacterium urealyticum]CAQ05287.1 DNA repair protein RecO [Corynebacterium urealyticum DSM 7109]SNV87286.1 DNA repair protein RecO [Corynebacterium urealyticum]